ncbi:MAG: MBL fold metallo-hydrolase [Acidobacteria bacterium]|nr:MBL fold metallo-hydrolase [Acidobacteriota bacterium]
MGRKHRTLHALFACCATWGVPQDPPEASVRHLANAGVLLQSGNSRVAVDFPFTGGFDWAVWPTESQIGAWLRREAPFDRLDAVVFTHDHLDHFDPGLVAQGLALRPETVLVGTTRVLQRVREAAAAPLRNPMFEARAGQPIQLKGLGILPLKAPHARYWDIHPVTKQRVIYDDGYIHSAYHITLGGYSFLHGGDAHQIDLPPGTTADLLLLTRGVVRGLGLPAVKELHQRMGAQHTALIHLGPTEWKTLEVAIQSEKDWLSAFTERDLSIVLSPKSHPTRNLPPSKVVPKARLPVPATEPAPGPGHPAEAGHLR